MHPADIARTGYRDTPPGVTSDFEEVHAPEICELQDVLIREIITYLGIPSRLSGALRFILKRPARRFSEIAYEFDQIVQEEGLCGAARNFAYNYFAGLRVTGCEKIPQSGPLIIASNHPGSADILALTASILRPDLKMVGRDNPVFRRLPGIQSYLIYSRRDPFVKMSAARQCIRHLHQGGALLLFASGKLDPDPACMPGAQAALADWSPSLALFLDKVPDLRMQLACVSGVMNPACLKHPIARLGRNSRQRQMLAEMIDISRQVLGQVKTSLRPNVIYADPFSKTDFEPSVSSDQIMKMVTLRNKYLLEKIPTTNYKRKTKLE